MRDDVSEAVLDTLHQAGIRLGDDCMFQLAGLPVDTQQACVVPLVQAANRTGTQDGSMFMGVILGVAAVQGMSWVELGDAKNKHMSLQTFVSAAAHCSLSTLQIQ